MNPSDICVMFPPLTYSIQFPEIGPSQLVSNLAARGYSAWQVDLNMRFINELLSNPELFALLLEARTDIQGESFSSGRDCLVALFSRQLEAKQGRYIVEPIEDFTDLLMKLLAKGRLIVEMDLSYHRRSLASGIAAWEGLPDDHFASRYRPFVLGLFNEASRNSRLFTTMCAGIQEILLAPDSYLMTDVGNFSGTVRKMMDLFVDGLVSEDPRFAGTRVLGFSLWTPSQVGLSMAMAARLRVLFPEAVIIAGGPWCTTARHLFQTCPELFDWFDYLVVNEGEVPLDLLLRQLSVNDGPGAIPGTWRMGESGPESLEPLPPISFDELKPPVLDGLNWDHYPVKMVPVRLGRGCYWGVCTFCFHVDRRYNNRYKTSRDWEMPSGYLEELFGFMSRTIESTGINHFYFTDHEVSPRVLKQFSREVLTRGLKIRWEAMVRFEPEFTRELCADLAASGCIGLRFGLETMDDAELKLLNKGIGMDLVTRIMENLSGLGIQVDVFMINMPSQTREELVEILHQAREHLRGVGTMIVQRFCLSGAMANEIPLGPLEIRVATDPLRDLNVNALEYHTTGGGMSLEDYMTIHNAAIPKGTAIPHFPGRFSC